MCRAQYQHCQTKSRGYQHFCLIIWPCIFLKWGDDRIYCEKPGEDNNIPVLDKATRIYGPCVACIDRFAIVQLLIKGMHDGLTPEEFNTLGAQWSAKCRVVAEIQFVKDDFSANAPQQPKSEYYIEYKKEAKITPFNMREKVKLLETPKGTSVKSAGVSALGAGSVGSGDVSPM